MQKLHEEEIEELNKDYNIEELNLQLRRLKNSKALGIDGITNEFYKGAPESLKTEILKRLNEIWRSGEIKESWKEAAIFTIFKAGDRNDTTNYRGVSLLNTSYKIMTGLMNERLKNWLEKNKKIEESQNGFRKGYGTQDLIIIMNTIIENKIKEKRGKVWVMFLDLKAAFDKVNRKIIFQKMRDMGIQGNMMRLIEKIYKESKNKITTRNEEGENKLFWTGKGVKQGCPLSPTLFSIYINGMQRDGRERT